MNDKSLPETIRLVKGDDNEPWADSRDVAKRLARKHFHILESITRMDCSDKFYHRNFRCFKINDLTKESKESISHYLMTEAGFVSLCRSLRGGVATEIFEAFVEEFYRMREELARRQEPANLNDAATLRGLLLGYSEKVLALEGEVSELKPDAEGMRMLRSAEGTMTLTQVAKMLEVKRPWLFDLLTECGWLYIQNGVHQPYAPLMRQGMLTVDPRKGKAVMRSSGAVEVKVTTLVTPKGLAKITEIVKGALEREAAFKWQETQNREKMSRLIDGDNGYRHDDENILNEIRHDDAVYGHGED
jgi:Rha family phage regulatory protein